MRNDLDCAVIGAGVSGLAVATFMAESGLEVAVFERAAAPGGVISSRTQEGFAFELGPNTVLGGRPEIERLIAGSGLAHRLLVASEKAVRWLWLDGRLQALPMSPPAFVASRVFTVGEKLRLLKEPFVGRAAGDDESVASFVRRRLGEGFLRKAAGPFVSGIYAGDPERISMRYGLRRLHAIVAEHGSLLRGALARGSGGAPKGRMISFPTGLAELTGALGRGLGARLHLGAEVAGVEPVAAGFRVVLGGESVAARQVVMAVDVPAAAALLAPLGASEARAFAAIPMAPLAVVFTGWRREQVRFPVAGFGFLAPRGEGLSVLGAVFGSALFPGRAPEGTVAITCFLGGALEPELVARDDKLVLDRAVADLERVLGVRGTPIVASVARWSPGLPQYNLGHGAVVAAAAALEARYPGLHLAGNFVHGVSVPDCAETAACVAARVVARSVASNATHRA